MGTRGPKANQEFGDQKAVLSTRISQETRDALDAAAAANGRPLSREVEYRLRRSFEDDMRIAETFGGPQIYAMLRTIAASMQFAATAYSPLPNKAGDVDWLNEPDAYDRAIWSTLAVLDALRPPGTPAPGKEWARLRKRYGIGAAGVILEEIENSPPMIASPAEKLAAPKRLYRRIASDLGEIAARRQSGRNKDDKGRNHK